MQRLAVISKVVMRSRLILLTALFLILTSLLPAAITLPRLISDHMMFQQGIPARVWGKAGPGETVTVRFREQSVSARAGADGRWEVFLAPMAAGGPWDLVIQGGNSITVRDVLVGEVWVASGQSNMEWPVVRSANPDQEAAAANYPQLRLFKVRRKTAERPQDDVDAEWQACSPATARDFSAVGYYFARYLHQELKIPVGVIQSAWGGTPAQSWTSLEALNSEPVLHRYLEGWDDVMANYPAEKIRYQRKLEEWEKESAAAKARGETPPGRPWEPAGPGHPNAPASLFNGMIAPLTPYAIRGAIWYQGESNANRNEAALYRRLFQAMILDWRARWGQGSFPFLFVQLANFAKTWENSAWPELRESQTATLDLHDTGMAVIIDIGEADDIHPRNKQDVGKRLALWALAKTYGKQVSYSGPLYRQVTREDGRLRLWFDHAARGLRAEGSALKGFVIAGEDRIFHPADARIDGETVVVSSPAVPVPVAARYAWADDPENNLRNSADQPASPFRTDQWKNGQMPK